MYNKKNYRPIKTRTTIGIDDDIINKIRSFGPGYQSRINKVLRRFVEFELTHDTKLAWDNEYERQLQFDYDAEMERMKTERMERQNALNENEFEVDDDDASEPSDKQYITMLVDADVLDYFTESGRVQGKRINRTLRRFVEEKNELFADILADTLNSDERKNDKQQHDDELDELRDERKKEKLKNDKERQAMFERTLNGFNKRS